MPTPDVLSTPELAAIAGLSPRTVLRRGQTDPRWSACIIGQTTRSTDWSRARLILAGILCAAPSEPIAPVIGLSFDVSLQPLRMG